MTTKGCEHRGNDGQTTKQEAMWEHGKWAARGISRARVATSAEQNHQNPMARSEAKVQGKGEHFPGCRSHDSEHYTRPTVEKVRVKGRGRSGRAGQGNVLQRLLAFPAAALVLPVTAKGLLLLLCCEPHLGLCPELLLCEHSVVLCVVPVRKCVAGTGQRPD